MNKKDFEELKAAVVEMVEIEQGKRKPVSVVEIPTPKQIREKLELSQPQFAELVGVKVATLRNWEQGRRKIPPTARTIFRIAQKYPKIILEMAR